MRLGNSDLTYGGVAQFFHWLIFILIFFMLILGYSLTYSIVPKHYLGIGFNIHKLTGLSILVLMTLRGMWALMNPKPKLPFDTPKWQFFAERTVHTLLYLTILAMPVAGWIGSIADGRPPHLGQVAIGLPIEKSQAIASNAFDIHNTLAVIIIVLVSIHILAALFHHFIKRDDILNRMIY